GLFHRAIVQSGGPNLIRSQAISLQAARTLLRHAGVNGIDGLRSLSTQDLLAAQASLLQDNFLGGVRVFGPAVDGCVLTVPPLHATRSGSAKNVALLTGTTKDEARLWSLYDPKFGETSPEALSRWLQGMKGPNVDALQAAYRLNRPQVSSC